MKAIPSISSDGFSVTTGDNTLSKVSRAYKQLLDSQMKAWGALAEQLRDTSLFVHTAGLTAHNASVRLNPVF